MESIFTEGIFVWASGIFWALLGLGVLIFIHEMGHLLAARWSGIAVEAFSIGFGKAIIQFRWKEIDWKVGWIPFGGYCKMKGQEDFKEAEASNDPDDFYNRPAWARLVTVFAGPLFNIILGIILLTGFYYIKGEFLIKNDKIIVKEQYKKDLPQLQDGDIIQSIDGKPVESWNDVRPMLIEGIAKNNVPMTINRNGEQKNVTYEFDKDLRVKGEFGFTINHQVKVGIVEKNSPAEKAKLQSGDIILSVDGKEVNSIYSLISLLNKDLKQKDHKLSILRNNKKIDLDVSTIIKPEMNRKVIGIEPLAVYPATMRKTYSLVESIPKGLEKGFDMIGMFFMQFQMARNLKAETLRENVAGPVGIIVAIGTAGNRSFFEFLSIIALISILLGLFNLLPIPAVDGGHIALTLFEMIRRKRVSLRVVHNFQLVGIFIILSLAILVTFNDIYKLIAKFL